LGNDPENNMQQQISCIIYSPCSKFIRREMRPQKGRFGVVPYVENKLFPSFAKIIKKIKN